MKKNSLGHLDHMQKADNLGILNALPRPIKVVFLGAGSAFFRSLFTDVINIPGADRGEMVLVDIDQKRLDISKKLGERIVKDSGRRGWKVTAVTDRKKVLPGADYIINCIEVSGTGCVRFDNDIPLEYGVDQCIGDTIGPGGLFKALRTAPVLIEVLRDVEKYCPDAWFLNYTNPMNILCLVAARTSKVKFVGLCHSVQHTSHQLANYLEVPYHELNFRCGGINHLAWFTELSRNGKDLYPELRKRIEKSSELLKKDPVRFDLFKYFDYFVTESSGHFSEYIPYYRKNKKFIKQYCGKGYLGESSFYADNWPQWRQDSDNLKELWATGKKELDLARTWEYASYIIEARETNAPFVIWGNVPNSHLIDNLPEDGVVEVGCVVNRAGITPTHFGKLPTQCAALCSANMAMFDLAAEACIARSKKLAAQSLMLDPLTAAVCSLAQIKEMTDRLFEAEKAYLSGYR